MIRFLNVALLVVLFVMLIGLAIGPVGEEWCMYSEVVVRPLPCDWAGIPHTR